MYDVEHKDNMSLKIEKKDLRGSFEFSNSFQFFEHTQKHIENVKMVAEFILRDLKANLRINPDLRMHFNIPENSDMNLFEFKFRKMIEIHDISKINTSEEFLEKHKLKEPIYKTLSNFAGVKLEGSDRDLINKLNGIDQSEMSEKARSLEMSEWEENLSEIIEHLADIVERGCNPITAVEMNKQVLRASEFNNHLRPEIEQSLIENAENYYSEKILKNQYEFAFKILTPVVNGQEIKLKEIPSKIIQSKYVN